MLDLAIRAMVEAPRTASRAMRPAFLYLALEPVGSPRYLSGANPEFRMFKTLDHDVAVSPQITADDVETAASLGYGTIMCNRPDGEEPGAPSAAEIEAAAQAAGLSFLHVPFTGANITDADVEGMTAAMKAPGKLLAYCRSGTRSATLWALAATRDGMPVDDALSAAQAAGYDLSGFRPRLG